MPHEEKNMEFTPSKYPPFPDNLKTIDLATISLKKLQNGDNQEQDRMFEACKSWGFFYLDLVDSDQGRILDEGAEDIARVAERTMALSQEEKLKYSIQPEGKTVFGYKSSGYLKVDKTQTPDTAEFFNVSKNDMIVGNAHMRRKWPSLILENKALLACYVKAAHSVGLQILSILAVKLGIDPEDIHRCHKLGDHSGDHIRMTRGPPRKLAEMPEIQTPVHTDFGTITILRNWLGGLQIFGSPNRIVGNLDFGEQDGEWMWVRPKKSTAIVNLGDAAVKYTNGMLCSGRHRVIPAPGEQGKWPRYSIVYFVRPTDDSKLKTLKGAHIPPADDEDEEGVTAKDWIWGQTDRLAKGR